MSKQHVHRGVTQGAPITGTIGPAEPANLSSNSAPVGYLHFAYGGLHYRCNRVHGSVSLCWAVYRTHAEADNCGCQDLPGGAK